MYMPAASSQIDLEVQRRDEFLRALDGEIEAFRKVRERDSFTTWALVAALGGLLYLATETWAEGPLITRDVLLWFTVFSFSGEAVALAVGRDDAPLDRVRRNVLQVGLISQPPALQAAHILILIAVLLELRDVLPPWATALGIGLLGVRLLHAIPAFIIELTGGTLAVLRYIRRELGDLPQHALGAAAGAFQVGAFGRRFVQPVMFLAVVGSALTAINLPLPGSPVDDLQFAALMFIIASLVHSLGRSETAEHHVDHLYQIRRRFLLRKLPAEDLELLFSLEDEAVPLSSAVVLVRAAHREACSRFEKAAVEYPSDHDALCSLWDKVTDYESRLWAILGLSILERRRGREPILRLSYESRARMQELKQLLPQCCQGSS